MRFIPICFAATMKLAEQFGVGRVVKRGHVSSRPRGTFTVTTTWAKSNTRRLNRTIDVYEVLKYETKSPLARLDDPKCLRVRGTSRSSVLNDDTA